MFDLDLALRLAAAVVERQMGQSWLIIGAFDAVGALVVTSNATTTAARGEVGITTANLAMRSPENLKIAEQSIVIAVIWNALGKSAMAVFMGAPTLRRKISLITLLLSAGAAAGILVA